MFGAESNKKNHAGLLKQWKITWYTNFSLPTTAAPCTHTAISLHSGSNYAGFAASPATVHGALHWISSAWAHLHHGPQFCCVQAAFKHLCTGLTDTDGFLRLLCETSHPFFVSACPITIPSNPKNKVTDHGELGSVTGEFSPATDDTHLHCLGFKKKISSMAKQYISIVDCFQPLYWDYDNFAALLYPIWKTKICPLLTQIKPI